jgi:error-prone DNA polymerase
MQQRTFDTSPKTFTVAALVTWRLQRRDAGVRRCGCAVGRSGVTVSGPAAAGREVSEVASGRSWSPQEHQHTLEELGTEARRAAAAAEVVQAAARKRPTPADLPPFAHLSVRSSYSMRDGAIRPRELAAAAAAAGMTHVALTDRDGLYGVVRFAQAAVAEGVTPVFGTDLALAPDATRPGWELTRAGRHRLPVSDAVRTGTTAGGPQAGAAGSPARSGADRPGFRGRMHPDPPGDRGARGGSGDHDPRGAGGGSGARGGSGDHDGRGGSGGRGDGEPAPAADPRARRPGRGAAWLEDDAPRAQFLAATQAGYADLCRTVSAAHAAERGDPHLADADLALAAASDGVIALLGPDAPVGRLLARGQHRAAEQELRHWLDVFGRERVVLGVRDHRIAPGGRRATGRSDATEPGDDARIRRTLELADHLGVRAVAVNDVRYLRPEDVAIADVLRCIRQQVPLGAHHLGRTSAEAWFTTPAEQHERFRERPGLLTAAHELATSCEVDLGLGQLHVPRLSGLSPEAAAGELHRRCWEGVAARYPRVTPQIRERLERELDMVDRLALHDLFLAVAAVVADVRELGVLVACRGSAAGSLVCFALRISDVDPVANDLAFERFMNPYRDELPDIDLDVESHRREDVYDLVMARFGETRTATLAMVETFQARMAVREVGKVLGLPREELDVIASSFTHARARDVRRVVAGLPELKRSNLDAGQLATLFDVVERIDGFPRHLAMHPCGILLGDVELATRTPMERSAHGYAMSQFDKDDVAALGLLKLDVLGVRMLSAMRHCLDLTNGSELGPGTREPDPSLPGRDAHGRLSLDHVPTGDEATYALIRSGHSVGMFQIESPGQRELLGRLQPDRFGDLVTEISLFRPGPVKADMVSPYVARRHGQEPTTYAHPSLAGVLAETYGVIVYHEQVMGVLAALTGCDLAYADLLRRQLADERRRPTIRTWVLARAADRGVSRTDAEQVWDQLASFASFGFCKAHAAAFAVPTERSAFLKAHVFPEFMAGLLTHDPGMYPRRMLLDECRLFGVAVLPPDVNRAQVAYSVEVVDRGLADHRLGLTAAVRAAAAQAAAGTGGIAGTPGTAGIAGAAGAAADDGDLSRLLPPGWRWPDGAPRPVPPSGVDAGEAGHGYRYAVRIGLKDVAGSTEAELAALTGGGRPFTSLEDLRIRGGLSRPTATALVNAGALDALAGVGRRGGPSGRRALTLAVEELWRDRGGRRRGGGTSAGRGADRTIRGAQGSGAAAAGAASAAAVRGEQTTLDLHADHIPVLPEDRESDRVRAELAATGMDVSRHVISFYEPLLEVLGVTRACDLATRTTQSSVRVAGVKVAVQSPAQRSGQRVLFLSLDDRTGQTQTTYFERSLDDCAWTVLHAWLLVAEGRVSRRGNLGATVTGTRAWDLSRLWRAWQEGWLDAALAERGTPAPHERTGAPRPRGLHVSEFGRGAR